MNQPKFSKMYELNLSLPMLPDSLNKGLRTHRFKYAKKNRNWDLLILASIGYKIPPKPLVKAHIRLVRHSYRTLDYDGLVGSMKPVVDALVSARVLKDDSWNVLGVWEVTQCFRSKKDGPVLTIEVREL